MLKRRHNNTLILALALVWICLCSVGLVKDYTKVSYGGFDIWSKGVHNLIWATEKDLGFVWVQL